ncbi:MAG: type II toxin-antitoxin system HicB family antitoxin [Chthoniobacteraceae bacterium]
MNILSEYIQAAMREAQFELMENGDYFGSIPSCQGAWADAPTVEECRVELQSVLEDWILVGFRLGHELPVVDGIDLNVSREPMYAETD